MFASHSLHRLALVAVLIAAQLGGCAPGIFAPAPYMLDHEGETFEVRRYGFLPVGFVEYTPVDLRRADRRGIGLEERALALEVLAAYCRWFRFEVGPPAATYWTEDGTWHFARGCARRV